MHRRRSEILADGQDIGALRGYVAHRREHLFVRLAEPDHDAALANEVGRALLRAAKHLERTRIARLRAPPRIEALDRLDVLVHDLGPLREYGVERRRVTDEVGDEHLDRGARGL